MGNCLDIPPPPPKRSSAYTARPRYIFVRRGFPVASAAMAREYPPYQPYPFFGGFRPPMTPQPIPEPFYTYGFEPPSTMRSYYADSDYYTYSSQDYDEHTSSRESRVKKHRRAREKRSRHADSVDRHSQRLSSDITRHDVISAAAMNNIETSSISESATTVALASLHVSREVSVKKDPNIMWQAVPISSDVRHNDYEVAPVRKTSAPSDSEIEEIIIDDTPEVTTARNQVKLVKDVPDDDPDDDFLHSKTKTSADDQVGPIHQNGDPQKEACGQNEPPNDNHIDSFLQNGPPGDVQVEVVRKNELSNDDHVDAFIQNGRLGDDQIEACCQNELPNDDYVDAFIQNGRLGDDQIEACCQKELPNDDHVDAFIQNEHINDDPADAFYQSMTALEGSFEQNPEQHGTGTLVAHKDTSGLISLEESHLPKHSTYSPCDVVICHHSADQNVMLKIKSKLESSRVTVAVSYSTGDNRLVDWLMFPQAVVDAKIMVVLLSQKSVKDIQTADLVCLAHATDTILYPVTLDRSLDLDTVMDACLKLQLSCYKWIQLADGDNPDFAIAMMTRSVKEDLVSLERTDVIAQGGVHQKVPVRYRISRRRRSQQKKVTFGDHVTAAQYWETHYGNETNSVPWDKFYEDLHKHYRHQWNDFIPHTVVLSLRDSLKEETRAIADGTVHRARFLEFCNNLDIDQDVWDRIQGLAIEMQSVAHVLSETSSVRMVAIENIAKFGSQKALSALRALVSDNDPNIRAVAAMSLSRSMAEGDQAILNALLATLDDKNGLVRETVCLALGRLRAKAASPKLRSLCLNDPILQVRDAAAVALNEIERKGNISF